MTASAVRTRRNKIFQSVFPTDVSQPTPILSATARGQAFGILPPRDASSRQSPQARRRSTTETVTDQVKWDRAWHTVTSRIQLPTSVTVEDSFGALVPQSQDDDTIFYEALGFVLNPAVELPRATHVESILEWHTRQTRQHFIHHVLPLLAACAGLTDAAQAVRTTIQTLEAAHRQYLYCLLLVVRGIPDESVAEKAVAGFRRDLTAIIGNSWTVGLVNVLQPVLDDMLTSILGRGERYCGHSVQSSSETDSTANMARQQLLGLLESLQNVGLTGDKFQVLFAELMDSCMRNFIQTSYGGVWVLPQDGGSGSLGSGGRVLSCMEHLCEWIENQYSRLAVEIFSRIGGSVAFADVERWREIAVGRLATLRINELFDIVLEWPNSRTGLNDLISSVTTPQRRLQLTDTFSAALQRRLLHSGRSTLDILRTYISMIRTFHALDHSKVLLDRVVHALQLYLCQREDAVRIVVTGLLCDKRFMTPEKFNSKLSEMAMILDEKLSQRFHEDHEDLDWDDMEWLPDPVDAGVNYKRPKNEDVIGTLISALGSEDIFIKEFQSTIAERLLSRQPGFEQELKVLHLLKRRFGENALQNCDVMVRDVRDSRGVNAALRKAVRDSTVDKDRAISYNSKILSRLFWPNLAKDSFKVPAPVAQIQGQYEHGFEQLKTSRKLNWLNQLGSATVQLDLEDRSIDVECKTYEAAVIYEFHAAADMDEPEPEQSQQLQPTIRRTFNDLWQTLMIDEDLLDLALRFWISKRVLRDVGDQTYEVVERLNDHGATNAEGEGDMDSSAAVDDDYTGGNTSPKKSKTKIDSKEEERRTVYWQFIVGMLTNSAPAMPLGQIAMMMKMLIADGCSWSNEELQEFLGEKIAQGELELVGGKYRLQKK